MSYEDSKKFNAYAKTLITFSFILGSYFCLYYLVSYLNAFFLSWAFSNESIGTLQPYLIDLLISNIQYLGNLIVERKFLFLAFPLGSYIGTLFLHKLLLKRRLYWLIAALITEFVYVGYCTFYALTKVNASELSTFINSQFIIICFATLFLLRSLNVEEFIASIQSSSFGRVGSNDTHGSASFLEKSDSKKIVSDKHDGLILDGDKKRLTRKSSFQNCLICAPTGVGKTQTFILPNILRATDESIVITDPSGEIFKFTHKLLSEKGYNLVKLQPFSENDTEFFNPLIEAKTLSEVKQIANTLVAQVKSDNAPFWHTAAASFLTAFILLCKDMSNDIPVTFESLKKLIVQDEDSIMEVANDYGSDQTILALKQAYAGSKDTTDTVRAVTLSSIDLFTDEKFANLTNKNTINFSDLRNKKTILYIVIPEHKIQYSSPFLALFYSQLFDSLLDTKEGSPVYVYLEEFANIGKIPDFDTIITTSRKRNISISLIIQDIEQVETRYKGKLETIISGGCLTKVFYSGAGVKTTEYVSRMCGKRTVVASSDSKNDREEMNMSESEAARALLNPDEIRRLKEDEAIVVHKNLNPFRIRIVPAYRNAELKKYLLI